MRKYIYFDHAATTPLDPSVLDAMLPYFQEKFGNPSSPHSLGQEASHGVEQARGKIADFLGAKPDEIFFTSGATESDNLAIRGTALALNKTGKGRIITSAIEHPAVLEVCEALEREGFKLTKLAVDRDGIIKLNELKKAITDDTFLITIMYVNNEMGAVEPIQEIGEIVAQVNHAREKNKIPRLYFHTDAVQAINLMNCKVDELKVDLLSLSGHKIYAPKGVGALYVRKGTAIKPIQYGGHHESGLRPGTVNAPLICGLGKAIELLGTRQAQDKKTLQEFHDRIVDAILKKIPKSKLNGDPSKKSPAHINITFNNVEGESLLLMLDLAGIAVSTGSACASGSLDPSHVLKAIGLSDEACHGSVRISLGRENTLAEVNQFLDVLPGLVKKIRERSPLK